MLMGNPYLRNITAFDATPLKQGGTYLGTDSGQGTPQPVQFTCPTADGSNPYAKQNIYANSGLCFPMANCDAFATGMRTDIYFYDCCKTSPAHYFLVRPDLGHRDIVSVLPCFPRKDKIDVEKYNRGWQKPHGLHVWEDLLEHCRHDKWGPELPHGLEAFPHDAHGSLLEH